MSAERDDGSNVARQPEPVPDRQTVTATCESLTALPEGVSFRPVPTHVDDRGAVVELFDLRWGWRPEPVVFAYRFTVARA